MSPTVFVCRDGPTLKILKRIGNGNPIAVWLQYGRMGRGVPSSKNLGECKFIYLHVLTSNV